MCHPSNTLLILPILILPIPRLEPILHISSHPIRPSCIHPQRQRDQSSPECYPPSHPEPEDDGLVEHVEDFEGDEEDYEQEGDGCEVGLLRDLVEEWEEVGFGCEGEA